MFILWLSLLAALFCSVPCALLSAAYVVNLRSRNRLHRTAIFEKLRVSDPNRTKILGFFHPFCNAGGGGERVLWTAIAHLQRTQPNIVSVVYTGDIDATPEEIIEKAKLRFDIILSLSSLHFVYLRSRDLIEDKAWPRFTLAGQSLGSMYLAWEAMHQLIPDLFIDTMGYAFTFHVVSGLGGIPVGAYVHYPTISTEMISRVKTRTQWHTNSNAISSSSVLSAGKLMYYRLFMYYYGLSLQAASFLTVNSSWTKNHIDFILQRNDPVIDTLHLLPPLVLLKLFLHKAPSRFPKILYPPCDTRAMATFPLGERGKIILSIAQFRPEKNHSAQLYAFAELLKLHPEYCVTSTDPVRLVLVGGSRTPADQERVESLRKLANELQIDSQVEFVVNAPYHVVLDWLAKASVGLSTMVDEHFGIGVVEFMASGVIPVTHASGGPLRDIVIPFNNQPTGYHATSPESFAGALRTVFSLVPSEELAMRARARALAVRRFSQEEFERGWDACGWRDLLPGFF